LKITNGQIENSTAALRDLGALPLPVKASFAISTRLRRVEDALIDLNTERQKLIDQYGEKTDDGRPNVSPEGTIALTDPEGFRRDMTELLTIEIEIDTHPFPLSLLGDAKVTPSTLATLSWLVDGDK